MKLKAPSILYSVATAIVLIYLLFSFIVWLPSPLEMAKGTGSVGVPAGAIVGIFFLPFAALFYVAIVWGVAFLALKLYDNLNDENRDVSVETAIIKRLGQVFMFGAILFVFFQYASNKIVIEGRINALKSYSIGVKYRAQRGGFFCTEWSMWNGTHRKGKYYKYYPEIENDEHHIEIPTNKFFFSFCDYEVEKIEIDINHDKVVLFEKKNRLVYVAPPYKKQIRLIKSEENIYTLDIGAVEHIRSANSSLNEREKYILRSKQKEEKELVKLARERLRSLAFYFNEFSSKHLRFPSQEEAKELFYLHQNLSFDSWGNHYKYEISKNYQRARLVAYVAPILTNKTTKYKVGGSYIRHNLIGDFETKQEVLDEIAGFLPLFQGFYQKNKVYPSLEEGEKLLRTEGNLTGYFNSPHLTKEQNNQNLKICLTQIKKIKHIDAKPVDMWGKSLPVQ